LHFFAPIYFAFRRRERDSNLTLNRIYYQHFKEATNSRLTNCSLDFIALLSDANPYLKLQKMLIKFVQRLLQNWMHQSSSINLLLEKCVRFVFRKLEGFAD
jgi:hypothetical protein